MAIFHCRRLHDDCRSLHQHYDTGVKISEKGFLSDVGNQRKPLTDTEMELARLRRELAEVKMERDFLKKAAAYFAKEPKSGTRS